MAFPTAGVGFVAEVTDPRHIPLGTQRFATAAEKRAAPEVVPSELAEELVEAVGLFREDQRLVRVAASDDRGPDETGVGLPRLGNLRRTQAPRAYAGSAGNTTTEPSLSRAISIATSVARLSATAPSPSR